MIDVQGFGAIGFNGAQEQFEKFKAVVNDCKKLDPKFECLALFTDNENTMKAMRQCYRDEDGNASGCTTHAANKALGMTPHTILYYLITTQMTPHARAIPTPMAQSLSTPMALSLSTPMAPSLSMPMALSLSTPMALSLPYQLPLSSLCVYMTTSM